MSIKDDIKQWAEHFFATNAKIHTVSIIEIRPEHKPYVYQKNYRAIAYVPTIERREFDQLTEGSEVFVYPKNVHEITDKYLENIENNVNKINSVLDLIIVFRKSSIYPKIDRAGIILIEKLKE